MYCVQMQSDWEKGLPRLLLSARVLTLLPLVASPFQVQLSRPYDVHKRLSDLNYLIYTPGCREKTQLCHVDLFSLGHI